MILDTGILIASERARTTLSGQFGEGDDVVIAAITVTELRAGVELADDRHRAVRTEFLARVLESLPVEAYDQATAEVHGRLLAHVHRTGSTRVAHDLVIAATAIATKRTLVTTDRTARFDELPGVDCLVLT